MEAKPTIETTVPAEEPFEQPTSSKVSAVVNGLGNGAMVGGAAYLALPKLVEKFTNHSISKSTHSRGSIIATVGGAVLGTWYGIHEANQLEKYRDTIGTELNSLKQRVHTLEHKHDSHVQRVKQQRELSEEVTR